jgi:hypothetical protein
MGKLCFDLLFNKNAENENIHHIKRNSGIS